jgi:hypothetical protein
MNQPTGQRRRGSGGAITGLTEGELLGSVKGAVVGLTEGGVGEILGDTVDRAAVEFSDGAPVETACGEGDTGTTDGLRVGAVDSGRVAFAVDGADGEADDTVGNTVCDAVGAADGDTDGTNGIHSMVTDPSPLK